VVGAGCRAELNAAAGSLEGSIESSVVSLKSVESAASLSKSLKLRNMVVCGWSRFLRVEIGLSMYRGLASEVSESGMSKVTVLVAGGKGGLAVRLRSSESIEGVVVSRVEGLALLSVLVVNSL